MKLQRVGRVLSVFLLLGVFFYATTVKEFHYAFSAKYHSAAHTDNCDNHIHSTDREEDCQICKLDFIGLLHVTEGHYSFIVVFLPQCTVSKPEEALLPAQIQTHYLRGPPQVS